MWCIQVFIGPGTVHRCVSVLFSAGAWERNLFYHLLILTPAKTQSTHSLGPKVGASSHAKRHGGAADFEWDAELACEGEPECLKMLLMVGCSGICLGDTVGCFGWAGTKMIGINSMVCRTMKWRARGSNSSLTNGWWDCKVRNVSKHPDFDIAVEESTYSMYNDTNYPLAYNKIL